VKVAILGASARPDRYAHKAQLALVAAGHGVFPISRGGDEILGAIGYSQLSEIPAECRPIDTVTVYLRPELLLPLVEEIRELAPRRLLLNPGTEHPDLDAALEGSGIELVEACTLVLLQLRTF